MRQLAGQSAIVSIIVLSFVSSACATVSNRDQIIPVYSEQGRVAVYSEKSSKTPTSYAPGLVAATRRPNQSYFIERTTGERSEIKPDCKMRWLSTFGGNSVLAGIAATGAAAAAATGVGVFAALLAIDVGVTGDSFDCSAGIHINPAKENVQTVGKRCVRAIVAPPLHYDEQVSRGIATAWMSGVHNKTKACIEFVDFETARTKLSYLNIDNNQWQTFDSLDPDQLRRIGVELNANHIVFLHTKAGQSQDSFAVKPMIYSLLDLHQKKFRFAGKQSDSTVRMINYQAPTMFKKAVTFGFSLLPNSITLGSSSSDFDTLHGTAIEEDITGYKRASEIGLTQVQHPNAFAVWDSVGSLSVFVDGATLSKSVERGGENKNQSTTIQLSYLSSGLEGALTFHTPIGALRFGIGLGISPLFYQDNKTENLTLSPTVISTASYTAFATDQVFIMVSAQNQNFLKSHSTGSQPVDSEWLKLSEVRSVSVGIGYFFPTLRSQATKLANRVDYWD